MSSIGAHNSQHCWDVSFGYRRPRYGTVHNILQMFFDAFVWYIYIYNIIWSVLAPCDNTQIIIELSMFFCIELICLMWKPWKIWGLVGCFPFHHHFWRLQVAWTQVEQGMWPWNSLGALCLIQQNGGWVRSFFGLEIDLESERFEDHGCGGK